MQNRKISKKEITIKNGNREIYGMLYVPGSEEIKGAVILSHGYNGSYQDFDYEGRVLAGNGYYACTYDFCGGSANGRSRGLASTEMTLFTEKEDLIAVVNAISSLEALEGKKLYLLGGSQGGCVTGLAAAELKERIAALILYYPAFIIPDNWRDTFKTEEDIPDVKDFWGMRLGRNFFLSIRDLSVYELIGAYPNPVLILQGDRDEVVPMESSRKAAGIYPRARLTVLEGEGHGFTRKGTEKALGFILDFLMEN